MKIALVSPKGPLYRHRGGIFKKSLRYQPLTLTTLAALVPTELDARVTLYDEGIVELPDEIDADLIGMTVITGTAPRAAATGGRSTRTGSISPGWSSSMKPGPRPTWRRCVAGVQRACGCKPMCLMATGRP